LHLGDTGQLRVQLAADLFHVFRELHQQAGVRATDSRRAGQPSFALLPRRPRRPRAPRAVDFLPGMVNVSSSAVQILGFRYGRFQFLQRSLNPLSPFHIPLTGKLSVSHDLLNAVLPFRDVVAFDAHAPSNQKLALVRAGRVGRYGRRWRGAQES
jgi:hypothetical protein